MAQDATAETRPAERPPCKPPAGIADYYSSGVPHPASTLASKLLDGAGGVISRECSDEDKVFDNKTDFFNMFCRH